MINERPAPCGRLAVMAARQGSPGLEVGGRVKADCGFRGRAREQGARVK